MCNIVWLHILRYYSLRFLPWPCAYFQCVLICAYSVLIIHTIQARECSSITTITSIYFCINICILSLRNGAVPCQYFTRKEMFIYILSLYLLVAKPEMSSFGECLLHKRKRLHSLTATAFSNLPHMHFSDNFALLGSLHIPSYVKMLDMFLGCLSMKHTSSMAAGNCIVC